MNYEYQYVINGETILVKDMTREQLHAAVCEMIDLVEDIDDVVHNQGVARLIKKWRYG